MFDTIKAKVSLLEVICKDTGLDLRESGSNTYVIDDERNNGGCVFCHHYDCFKVRFDPENPDNAMFKCFSCDETGDVIAWRAKRKNITPKEAATELAREFSVELPSNYNPIQEVFSLAAHYYETCLWESKAQIELAKLTPVQYQTQVRKHSEAALKHFHVGWSDGNLSAFLTGLGYDEELLISTGLFRKKDDKPIYDYLPSRCFIYPHYVGGKVSHFTFKDPSKRLKYQLPSKFSLNGYEFYNQDSSKDKDTVIIVEGENDVISVWEAAGDRYAVIGTIGQISGSQLNYIRDKFGKKGIITLFDPDDAGSKYREKVGKIKAFVGGLLQVLPPNEKDIDELICEGADLDQIIKDHKVDDDKAMSVKPINAPVFNTVLKEAGLAVPEEKTAPESEVLPYQGNGDIANNSILERGGSYYKIKFDREGEPSYVKISDFIIKLKNIFITEDGDRHREVIVVREDGYQSKPILINSETKVSLKPFRTLLARAADADFRGSEVDMIGMWELVYSQNPETQVRVTRTVGRHPEFKGWLWRNKFISDSGMEVEPDADGIFWLHGRSIGIRPESLYESAVTNNDKSDIPFIETNLGVEEKDELLKGMIDNLARNINSPGKALLLLGWVYACVYSEKIIEINGNFPFLFFWGQKGKGKTTIAKWLQEFFDIVKHGYTNISQLKSAAGWARKIDYYSSIPLLIDEVRSDDETKQYIGTFRGYFDRSTRTLASRDSFGVRTQEVKSRFIFVGEDQFDDPAARERCIPIRIPVGAERELTETYKWIKDRTHLLSGITYQWIKEYGRADHSEIASGIRALDAELVNVAKCTPRTSKNWAGVGYFSMKLAEKYLPEFDFKKFLFKESTEEASRQYEDTTVSQFFELVEAIQAQEHVKITDNHICKDGDQVHIWFPAVYKIVNDEVRGRFPFSKNAVLSALREEPYFISDNKKVQMGLSGITNGARRTVLTLDLTKAPDSIKNIALG